MRNHNKKLDEVANSSEVQYVILVMEGNLSQAVFEILYEMLYVFIL